MDQYLTDLLEKSRIAVSKMTPAELEEMHAIQRDGWWRAEMSWPKPKFEMVNGVKVYASYEDYVND